VAFREGPLGDVKVPLAWTAAVALIIAAIVAFTLLANDRRETFKAEAYGATRQAVDTVAAPVGGVLSAPFRWAGNGIGFVGSYFNAASENRRLKRELAEMRQWQEVAVALKDHNERLEAVLGLRTDPPIQMASARVVLDSRGPFANARLANNGSRAGIEIGNPVMSERGLVGRIVGVTPNISRVLLLTDVASKTPVMIDRTNARAILTGDGGPNPKLEYLRGQDPVKKGDRVLTSGDGGVFPRGLPVGTAVKGLDGRWRVVLDADSAAIDFVRVLKFKDFSQLADQKTLGMSTVPPVTTEDPQVRTPPPTPILKPPATGAAPAPAARPATPTPRPPAPTPQPATPAPAPTGTPQ
jgi:rod shape-determining protein MreC